MARKIKTIKEIRKAGGGKRKKMPKTLKGKIAKGQRIREKIKAIYDEARNYAEVLGWDLAKRHLGDRRAFEDADTILICFMRYCEWVDSNPWPNADMRLYKGRPVDVGTGLKRPYSLSGFMRYCGLSMRFWGAFRANAVQESSDLLPVIDFVESAIRDQQIEGASVGAFKENIVALQLGLKSRIDVTSDDEKVTATPDMKIYQGHAPQFANSEAEIIKQLKDGSTKD